MLKKITLGLLGLTMWELGIAGDMGACHPSAVTVPCPCNKWNLGVEGLYLKPVYSGYLNELTPLFGGLKAANGDWDWGYRLEGSYHFNTGNDLTLSWLHFDNDSTYSEFLSFTPFTGTALLPSPLRLNTRFDQVNLTFGQSMGTGLFKHSYFYTGLQYARLRKNDRNLYLNLPTALAVVAPGGIAYNQNTDFNGLGPVVGIKHDYPLFESFSILANGEFGLLYGSSRGESWYDFYPSGLIPTNAYGSKKAVVPEFAAKLGLNYAISCIDGVFNIEGGYQALTYLNGLQDLSSLDVALVRDVQFGLYGPYLGIKWVGKI